MVEKKTILAEKLKQIGIFNFKDYYNFMYDWLRNEGYDVVEKAYLEKVNGDSKDIEVKWEATRRISDYFKYKIELKWVLLGIKDATVEKEGKKIKMNSGSLEINFTSWLLKDPEQKWENKPWAKFLRGIYDKFIIRNRIEEYENELLNDTNELVDQGKAFLVLEAKR